MNQLRNLIVLIVLLISTSLFPQSVFGDEPLAHTFQLLHVMLKPVKWVLLFNHIGFRLDQSLRGVKLELVLLLLNRL